MRTIWQYFVSWDLCEYLVTRCSSKILWIVLILCPDFICWFWYIYTKIYTSKYLKIRISICPNIQCITNISKPKYFYFFVNNILDYFDTENYTWRLVIVKIFMNFNNFSGDNFFGEIRGKTLFFDFVNHSWNVRQTFFRKNIRVF